MSREKKAVKKCWDWKVRYSILECGHATGNNFPNDPPDKAYCHHGCNGEVNFWIVTPEGLKKCIDVHTEWHPGGWPWAIHGEKILWGPHRVPRDYALDWFEKLIPCPHPGEA